MGFDVITLPVMFINLSGRELSSLFPSNSRITVILKNQFSGECICDLTHYQIKGAFMHRTFSGAPDE